LTQDVTKITNRLRTRKHINNILGLKTASEMTYRVAQKTKPLPNDQKIVLNRTRTCE